MKLPSKSTWHIVKGTWFVYEQGEELVHIHWGTTGKLKVYVNRELVQTKRSFKPRFDFTFIRNEKRYKIKVYPENSAMTSFTTELVIETLLVKTFTFYFKQGIKLYLPFIALIVVLTIFMVLLKLPAWSLYVMIAGVIMSKYLFFSKRMFYIEEKDNAIEVDI